MPTASGTAMHMAKMADQTLPKASGSTHCQKPPAASTALRPLRSSGSEEKAGSACEVKNVATAARITKIISADAREIPLKSASP